MSRLLPLLVVAPMFAACAVTTDEDMEPRGPDVAEAIDDGKADTTGELRVRAGDTTVWIDRRVTVSGEGEDLAIVVHGRASRTVTGAFSFVPDDAFGTARLVGPRSFEVELRGGPEINSVLSGLPLLVDLDVASGTEDDYALQLRLAPTLGGFTGSSALHVDALVSPIFIGKEAADPLRYQARVRTTSTGPLTVTGTTAEVYPVTGGFAADLAYGALDDLLGGDVLTFSQGTAAKSAVLNVRTTAIALTTGDAYDTWPTAACDLETYNCTLEHQGADLAACGTYQEVRRCAYADL